VATNSRDFYFVVDSFPGKFFLIRIYIYIYISVEFTFSPACSECADPNDVYDGSEESLRSSILGRCGYYPHLFL
jgi:hypothetical protein